MANILEKINIGKQYGLKEMVMYALSQSPRNGVEVMSTIEMMSFGTYKPSPGSIYPLLNKMAEEGLIRKNADGRYEITSAGLSSGDYLWHWQWWDHGPYTPYNVIGAIESYINFLQDAEVYKLAPYDGRLDSIIDRLQKLRHRAREAGQPPADMQKTC